MTTSSIGIMQGRLSAPPPDRIQAFPRSSWATEFDSARDLGLDTIEWLFEADAWDRNPIWTDEGLSAIEDRIEATGVTVRTMCADYFMVHPFFRVSDEARHESETVLRRLLPKAARIGITVVLVPVLEIAEIRTPAEAQILIESLRGPLDVAAGLGMSIGLETELPAAEFRALVESAGHPALGAYYDTGNAASRGYDTVVDLQVLGDLVRGVHLKDRTRGGPTVPLGTGAVDFPGVRRVLTAAGYEGPLILQSTAGEDFLGSARRHLAYVRALPVEAPPHSYVPEEEGA